jgi:hypothetical protein
MEAGPFPFWIDQRDSRRAVQTPKHFLSSIWTRHLPLPELPDSRPHAMPFKFAPRAPLTVTEPLAETRPESTLLGAPWTSTFPLMT